MGVGYNKPVNFSNFSLQSEIYFSRNVAYYDIFYKNVEYDLFVKNKTINVPVLLRLTQSREKFGYFFNVGPLLHYHFYNDNYLLRNDVYIDVVELLDMGSDKLSSEFQGGFSAGVGAYYQIGLRQKISLEVRFSKLWNRGEDYSFNRSVWSIFTGYSF